MIPILKMDDFLWKPNQDENKTFGQNNQREYNNKEYKNSIKKFRSIKELLCWKYQTSAFVSQLNIYNEKITRISELFSVLLKEYNQWSYLEVITVFIPFFYSL